MKFLPENSRGQTLLLVLLSMAVVLTIVLSVVARSVSDISISSREENALRAFSAAEAGIEKALSQGASIISESIGAEGATINATVSNFASGATNFVFPQDILSGDTATVWFVNHDDSGSLVCSIQYPCFTGSQVKVCWGEAGTPSNQATTPAIEVTVLYTTSPGDYSTMKIARTALDPYTSRAPANNFSAPDAGTCVVGGKTFQFQKTINFSSLGIGASVYNTQNGLQMARIRTIYNSLSPQPVGVDSGASVLPTQGKKIESTGTAGESSRKVEVYRLFPDLPPIFDAAVFSPGGLTK